MFLVLIGVVAYFVIYMWFAMYFMDEKSMRAGYAWIAGLIWPFAIYKAIKGGYFKGFLEELKRATTP